MEILLKYNLSELRQLAIYMEEFQNCIFVQPENIRRKKSWVDSLSQMINSSSSIGQELNTYIVRLRTIIRWFLNHRFKFVRKGNIFVRMTKDFIYTITPTNIQLEDSNRRVFNINREDMDLSKHAAYIANFPSNAEWITHSQLPTRILNFSPRSTFSSPRPEESLASSEDDDPLILYHLSSCMRHLKITDELVTPETELLECKICLTNKICVVLAECGHTFCYLCIKNFNYKCAVCRTPFDDFSIIQMYI